MPSNAVRLASVRSCRWPTVRYGSCHFVKATGYFPPKRDILTETHPRETALDIMGEVVTLHPNRADMESVRFGLRGWRGMQDARGVDAPFTMQTRIIIGSKRDVVSDDCLALLTMPLVRELAGEVRRMSDAKAVVTYHPVAEPSLVLPAA